MVRTGLVHHLGLDLNGFSVICCESGNDTPPGIVVVGRRATAPCSTALRPCGSSAKDRTASNPCIR